MKKRVSFKNHPRTGPYRTFQKEGSDIKMNGAPVGFIGEWVDKFAISLHMKVPSTGPCEFANIRLKPKFDSMKDAKQWVKDNWERLQKYPLHQLEE